MIVFHLKSTCPELKRVVSSQYGAHIERHHSKVNLKDKKEWMNAALCAYCEAEREAERDGEIDDMNSVWYGLGPDNVLAPARQGALA